LIKIYKTIILLAVSCGRQTTSLTLNEGYRLRIQVMVWVVTSGSARKPRSASSTWWKR